MPVAQSSSHGTKDMVVPYEGGASALHKSCDQCMLLSEGESNKRWAMHNGCDLDEGMVRPLLPPTPPPCAAALPPCAAAKPNRCDAWEVKSRVLGVVVCAQENTTFNATYGSSAANSTKTHAILHSYLCALPPHPPAVAAVSQSSLHSLCAQAELSCAVCAQRLP